MNPIPEDEILLSAEQLAADYMALKRGERIEVGHLFQEPHQPRKLTPGGVLYRFLPVKPDTFVNGVELSGIAWDPAYPTVVRPLPKLDPFSELEGDAREFFCRAAKDMIRGELIAIRAADNGTIHSDKLDFTSFNDRQTRSIASMGAEGRGRETGGQGTEDGGRRRQDGTGREPPVISQIDLLLPLPPGDA